jgi:MFS family permease
MAMLRTPGVTEAYGKPSPDLGRSTVSTPVRTHPIARRRIRNAIAIFVYSMGYPLLALAIWTGVRQESWTSASVLVALGVCMSFLGWALIAASGAVGTDEASRESERLSQATGVYLALYNRAGAIVVLLGSYALAARTQGWPVPQTFIGWFALVWVPLFVSFAIPVDCSSRSPDAND